MPDPRPLPRRIAAHFLIFPAAGLIGAGLLFACSLAPSLIPRAPAIQGVLSGFAAAVGYALGVLALRLWTFLELPVPGPRWARVTTALAGAATALMVGASLWLAADWQASHRAFLGMEPLDTTYAPVVVAIALPVALVLREIGWLIAWLAGAIARLLVKALPRRVAILLGAALAVLAIGYLASGAIGPFVLRSLDGMFLAFDELIEDDIPRPAHELASGGANSLISWRDHGRQGRRFVATGPDREAIAAFTGRPARQPIRVYVGLGAAETPEARAALALEEMKRVGAFDRSVLVVAAPTGTGWIDEEAVDPLEYLHDGDTAIVAQQYSYLTSYISVFVQPGYASTAAQALFDAVYGYWRTLPAATRPRLYLHGLSLGSYGSETSMSLLLMLGDLIQGAVWSGPTYANPDWKTFTRGRNEGSPYWLPTFGDGSLVRFTNQSDALDIPGARWGPVRLVYLQYASDPITFFSPDIFWHEPEWLSGPRGPDVSPDFTWIPVVTGLQVAFDMVGSSAIGHGLGHLFAAAHYIDAWVAVTEPEGWSAEEIARLKAHFAR